MRHRVFQGAGLALGLLAACALCARGGEWDGAKLKPTKREEVFEFTKKPSVRKIGKDRYAVSFASRGKCDVAVAIEDAEGRIVRHVVYGVLGSNAPEPLKADALEQTLVWDGKDDFGKYVDAPEACRVRVSLGLKPGFDKVLGWHPKDCTGNVMAIGAGREGVFVVQAGGYWQTVKAFDHDGKYLRTVFPFPADKLGDLVGMDFQPVFDTDFTPEKGQETGVPRRDRYGKIHPFLFSARGGCTTATVVANGMLAILRGGQFVPKQIVRIGVDGSSHGQSVAGPTLWSSPRDMLDQFGEMAASPDGKWLYVTRLGAAGHEVYDGRGRLRSPHHRGVDPRHAVFRVAWDQRKPIDYGQPFLGEVGRPPYAKNKSYYGNDERHFNVPEGIACDAKGRVYVSDYNNHRVQVFSPRGKHVTTIKVQHPRQIAVHHRTGEIYLLSYGWGHKKPEPAIVKFSPLPNPKEVARLEVAASLRKGAAAHNLGDFKSGWGGRFFRVLFCLDSWAKPARVWLTPAEGRIAIWADRGKTFEFLEDFDATVAQEGYVPHAYNGYKMNRVVVDPVRKHLYYVNSLSPVVLRMDPQEGKKWTRILLRTGGGLDGCHVGHDGLMYARTVQWLVRLDPAALTKRNSWKDNSEFEMAKEVPFDYGEVIEGGWGWKCRGGIRLPAQIPGNGFDKGVAVSPKGNVLALCCNYQKQTDRFESKGTTVPKITSDRYRPHIFPGRKWMSSELVFVWDNRGEMISEDVIATPGNAAAGIRSDKEGNLYVGLPAYAVVKGKPFGPLGGGGHGPGSVVKFSPAGGKVFGDWGDMVKLKENPRRPHEFINTMGHKLWSRSLLWSYPGMSTMTCATNICVCPQSRFDVDLYGRVFVPESWRYSVGVCDTNGNPVLHIGRYGNADSGRGPDSPVKVPGGIALSQADFLCTLSDRYLYVADTGNFRVVRVRLGYETEATVPVGAPRGAAPAPGRRR